VKSVGITGPPGGGKTTLWRAVTGGDTKGEVAVVDVPDPRLDVLVEMESSRKRVPIQIQMVDVHAGARSAAAAMGELRKMDALLVVVPAFGGQDAAAALAGYQDDLILADLGPFENRIERARKDAASRHEVPALEKAVAHLESGQPLRTATWQPEELKAFAPMAAITLKPVVVVFNVDEEGLAATPPSIDLPSFSASAALEAEVGGLGPEETKELLGAYGIEEPVLGKVIDAVYRLLDLITFFTTGDTESRAWEVRRGATAPEAAGVIHSDIQRGFIRAEIVGYDDLIAAGSWANAKPKGVFRLEGKEYKMVEGDVCHFRFAV
jgi:ribosome-binding ATPase YchF (GTP1/OBG family)